MAYSSATDHRTQGINEALQGIRIIKYFAWEPSFEKKIADLREKELSKIRGLWLYFLGFFGVAWSGSVLFTFFTFFFYCVVAGNPLDAATAFTSLTLLKIVSQNRIADFLDKDELEKYHTEEYTGVISKPLDGTMGENPTTPSALYFIGVCALISFASLLLGILSQIIGYTLSLMASRTMHTRLLARVLGSPMRFFEKTPVGRLLNRFTKDISSIDNECGQTLSNFAR
ncbi:hypothetical protein HDU76_005843 [Blyttiomyces sp. JEL0837]|nr:hypothetical protein HDU76_005843 [Blyttiomyces sp. JEL0837]